MHKLVRRAAAACIAVSLSSTAQGGQRAVQTDSLVIVAWLLTSDGRSSPKESAPEVRRAAEEEVLQVERELREAFLSNDGRALGRIYADDCTFTTPSGAVLDKRQEMQARSSGALRYVCA